MIKSTIMIAAAALLTLGSVFAGDTDTKISVRHAKNEAYTLVRVSNLSEKSALLRLKDANGRVLHREVIKGHGYMKKYDLANLPSGKYTLEVRSDGGVSEETFSVSAGVPVATPFKPAVQLEEDMLKVVFKNSVASAVSIKLRDESGRVLYQEMVASQSRFAKGLNLAKLYAGEYSLSITGSDYDYAKSIALK